MTIRPRSLGPKETPMNLPSNTRSLLAFGIFCIVAGAWLTFVTAARTQSLRGEPSVTSTSIIGDTGGNDIGNCTTDDAYITMRLPTIWFGYN